MGGLGSGKGFMQTTVEQCKNIDIRWLNKTMRLVNGSYSLKWSRNGNDNGSIGYTMYSDKMVLNFKDRGGEHSDWQTVTQTIYLETTKCNYGGSRKWLICPNCLKRVAILYAPQTYFYCRACYKLPYRSTLEGKTNRLYSKKHELGKKIFQIYKHGYGCFKKKGMHQKTFDRKLIEYRKLEVMVNTHYDQLIHILNKKAR